MSLRERFRRELANLAKRQAVAGATRGGVESKLRQWGRLAAEGRLDRLRDQARDVKERTLNDHGRYLGQFTREVQSRGGQVHFAESGEDAVAHILAIARQHGARRVVKTKSMATEEISLTHALEAAGIEAVETDLGEYIVQLAGEPPSHIVGPAIHLSRHDVAALFSRHHGQEIPPDPEALTALARRVLREKFLTAEIGITGANFGVAETGSILLVTNEGNADMITTQPRVMIALMGLEKLVPTWADLEPLLTLLPRTSTGQNMTVYVGGITGPRQPGEADGPDELHVVILDGGRSRLLGTPYQEALRCIRCGACLDTCPVFQQVGGHGYGTTYSGPIGAVITPLLKGGEEAGELLDACSMCGGCTETCPVRIPLHHLIRSQREDRAERVQGGPGRKGIAARGEKLIFRLWAWAWSEPERYRRSFRLIRWLARPFSRNGLLTWTPGPLSAWGEGRAFPAPAQRPLHERWKELEQEVERHD